MLRLRFERTHRRLSQAAVSEAADIAQPTLSLIERGRIVPTSEELRRLAAVFRVEPGELLRDVAMLESR